MNIIYIVSGTGMTGGATKSLLNLLRGVSKDNKCIIICPDRGDLYNYIKYGNISNCDAMDLHYRYDEYPHINCLIDYFLYLPRLLRNILVNRMAAKKLGGIARHFSPDFIHSNTSVNNIGYLVAKKLKIPHIWHIREYGDLDFNIKIRNIYKKLHKTNNYCIAITKDICRYRGLTNSNNAEVIYNGIFFKNTLRYRDEDSDYFLYAGRLTENKGIFDLIRAYISYLKKCDNANKTIPKCRLVIAGSSSGEVKSKILQLFENEDYYRYVTFLGERDDVPELMYKAKATIVPSLHEGFGRVLPEAMANGCLTIGRNTGGTKEQYDNGVIMVGREIGYRYNQLDELTEIMYKLGHIAKSQYGETIQLSQKVVEKLYSIESNVLTTLQFYSKIKNNEIG